MVAFSPDLQRYGPTVAQLLAAQRCPALGPGSPATGMRQQLEQLTPNAIFAGHSVCDADAARCCLAGLWLWFDFLEESHRISQQIDTDSGSYWHGIMHRREPDYSNAKYWFRRVGGHPVYASLGAVVPVVAESHDLHSDRLLGSASGWDPYHFVDLCQRHSGKGDAMEQACRELTLIEWYLLFDYCYDAATGG